jgi:AcrR family transcriptional regulator
VAGTVFFIWLSRSDEGGRRIAGVDKHERSYYFIDMAKGDETRERILQHAMAIASEVGFEGLSIGGLAKAADMSKSGLFAHFDSKEDLQLQALAAASRSFLDNVISPALREPRGEPRIRALFELWLTWEEGRVTPGGCPFIVASYEYDDRPGPVRDAVVAAQRDWVDTVTTAAQIAVDEGHFRSDLDTGQFAFDVYGTFLSFHLFHRLLGDTDARRRARSAFEQLIEAAR